MFVGNEWVGQTPKLLGLVMSLCIRLGELAVMHDIERIYSQQIELAKTLP